MSETILDVRNAVVRFGGVTAVDHADLAVRRGTIHAIIGPNGAGKTTLLNAISGLVPLAAGTVSYEGMNLSRLGARHRAGLGIARTFQNPALIDALSVRENIQTGLYCGSSTTAFEEMLRLPRANLKERSAREKADAALKTLGLSIDGSMPVASLPLGVRKMVDIARAWVARPRLLLLDEPTSGLDDGEIAALERSLHRVRQEVSIVVIAHHLDFVMRLASEVTVLDFGRVIASGEPRAVRNDPKVVAAYVGAADD